MSHAKDRHPLHTKMAELERTGEALRVDMDRTLQALQQKLSPRQLLDRSIHGVRQQARQLGRKISTTARHHPVPVLLAAGGLIWLTATVLGSRRASRPRAAISESSSSKAKSSGSDARRSRTQHQLANLRRGTRGRLQHAGEQLSQTVREQPMILGALAMAAGAVLSALLPTTKYERRILGPTHERAMGKAREVSDRPSDRIVHDKGTRLNGHAPNGKGR